MYEILFRDGHEVTIVAQRIDAAIDKAVEIANGLHEGNNARVLYGPAEHTAMDITKVDELARPVHVAEEVKDDDGGD
jgi:hypothetical protein